MGRSRPTSRAHRRDPPRAPGRLAPSVELYGKLEAANPGGSVKDRIGVAMIEAAEREGRIEPGRTTIVEATSGNTGIALAMVCAAKGYELVLTLPQGMSRERTALLRQYGARVELIESMGGMSEAVAAARELAARRRRVPARPVLQPRQPRGPPPDHRPGAPRGARRPVDAFVAGVGTGGTITGIGELLREHNPPCGIVAVEPASSAVLSGGRRPAPDPGHRRRLRPSGAQPRADRRGDRRRPTTGDRAGAARRARGGRARRHLVGAALAARSSWRRARSSRASGSW